MFSIRIISGPGIPQQDSADGDNITSAGHCRASRKTRPESSPSAYAQHVPPKAFLPATVIVTTDGVSHDDVLRFLWFLAERMA
eukprot:87671-Hanusia_phi.AAC.1